MKSLQILMMGSNRKLTFTTNKNGILEIGLTTLTETSITLNVSGYSSVSSINTLSHILSIDITGNTSNLTCSLEIDDFDNVTQIELDEQNITGTLNLSKLKYIERYSLFLNPDLNYIILPSVNLSSSCEFRAYSCDLITLDVSGLKLNYFSAYSNSNLTSLTIGSSNNYIDIFFAYSNSLLTSVDLSGLIRLGGQLEFYADTNLQHLILPETSENFSYFGVSKCSIGVLNWEALTGAITSLKIENNSFTSAEADETIVLLDENVNITGSLYIAETNAALTDGSITGFNGLAAKASLESKGVTVYSN